MLIKPTEGVSYTAILKDLKKHVKPDELGFTVHGIRETRSKDLLVELKCSKEDRGRLDTALKEVIVASGTVRHLIPMVEVEIADIEPNIDPHQNQMGLLQGPPKDEDKSIFFREAAPKRKPLRGRI